VKHRAAIPSSFLLILSCGPSEQEKAQVALDVYKANASRITAKREAMMEAFARVASLSSEEQVEAFYLGDKAPVDISTYPENAWLALKKEDIAARFITVDKLLGGFEIHANATLENVKASAERLIQGLDRLRYLGVIRILELREPKLTGGNEHMKTGITLGFVPGEAKARVHVFDLTDGKHMGSVAIEARNSSNVKLRPTEFDNQVKFELRQKIKEAATTAVQSWDEVNRKK